MSFRRICIAAAIALGAHTAQAAPMTWSVNGHEYEVIAAEGITWTAAQAATAALGGGWHLVTITTADENTFVTSLLPAGQVERSHYWLGGTDAAVEGTWSWVTGEAWIYTNWWGGEPNNTGNEDFLALDLRGVAYAWNDAPDNLGQLYAGFANGYVIERVAQVPEPATLSLLGFALLAGAFVRRKQ